MWLWALLSCGPGGVPVDPSGHSDDPVAVELSVTITPFEHVATGVTVAVTAERRP